MSHKNNESFNNCIVVMSKLTRYFVIKYLFKTNKLHLYSLWKIKMNFISRQTQSIRKIKLKKDKYIFLLKILLGVCVFYFARILYIIYVIYLTWNKQEINLVTNFVFSQILIHLFVLLWQEWFNIMSVKYLEESWLNYTLIFNKIPKVFVQENY